MFVDYAIVLLLAIQVIDTPERMRTLLRTLFVSGSIVSLYGLLEYFGIEPVTYGARSFEAGRSFATYGNPNILAGFLMFLLPVAVALALSEERTPWRVTYWIGALLAGSCLITAFTRSAWIGGAVSLVLVVVTSVRQRVRPGTADYVMGGIGASLAALLAWHSLRADSTTMNVVLRVKSIIRFGEGSALTRLQIWSVAAEAISKRPLFGFGLDTFRQVFATNKPAEYVAVAGPLAVEDNVHNYALQIAAETGLPGLLMLYGFFAWVLISTSRQAFAASSGRTRVLYAGVWAAVVGYLVHLFFGVSVAGTSVFLWLSLGLLLTPTARELPVVQPRRIAGLGVAALAMLNAALLAVANVRYIAADHQYLLARAGNFSAGEKVDATKRAVALNPLNDQYRTWLGRGYLEWAGERLGASDGASPEAQAETLQLMKASENAFEEAIAFIPGEYDNYLFLANLYNNMGRVLDRTYYEEAIKAADRGIAVAKYGVAVRAEKARALEGLGQTGDAIRELQYALELAPSYGAAAMQLADIYRSQGDLDTAIAVLKDVPPGTTEMGAINAAIESLNASRSTE